jgi:glycosyltransferase involved in cell wall biosynthesis
VIVHQVLAGAGPHDAVTAMARAYRRRFRQWGWGGTDHASFIAPGLNGAVLPRRRLDPAGADAIVVHHSAVCPRLDDLLALPGRKLLVYHNITPASWLWDAAPILAVHCAVGREQLPRLVNAVDLSAAVSEFNAAELREAGAREAVVVPPLLESAPPPAAGAAREPDPTTAPILFVGRLSPHKRQDEVIRAFALYRRVHAPGARLHLVGEPITPEYGASLRTLATSLVPGAVTFEEALPQPALDERYRTAAAVLCLSEHEGFCLPLLEAMRWGIPVVARAAGAVPETLGDAGLLVAETDDLAVVAEALHLAVSDRALRAELRRRAAARVEAFHPERAAAQLRAAVERVTN